MTTLTVLLENKARSRQLAAEHGLSLFVEHEDMTLLFDTGPSPAFMHNARLLGCDLHAVSHIVLSHGHNDHTGGLEAYLQRLLGQDAFFPPLVAHPDVVVPRWIEELGEKKELGMSGAARQLLEAYPFVRSRKPVWLRQDVVFLGEIPRPQPDACALCGSLGEKDDEADPLSDDSALVILGSTGLLVITGCAHSGLPNILDYAKAVTGQHMIHAVVGGLHLAEASEDVVQENLDTLRSHKIPHLYGCHCTGDILLEAGLGSELMAGDSLSF